MPPPSRPRAVAQPQDERLSEPEETLAERVTEPAVYDEPPAEEEAPATVSHCLTRPRAQSS